MAMLPLGLKPEFGYVAATALAGWGIHHLWMAFKVGAARKKFGVPYPALYADASHAHAKQFNCVQRGHQNSLENLPAFYALLLLGGLQYPVTAAIGGAVYLLGRILYMNGYASGDPDKRMQGSLGYIGLFTLVGCVGKFAYDCLSVAR